jgi:diguanylate cyclase (GGDEF)-like protein
MEAAKFLVLVLLWLVFPLAARAMPLTQSPAVFQHLTTADGLPQSTVNVAYRDSQGFVWIGTEDGLVRYDGHRLVRYGYRAGDATALPGNYIKAVVEAPSHDLWVAVADGGLARWNRSSDRFTIYRHDAADPGSLASNDVTSLVFDENGRLWIGTGDAGLEVLEPQSGRFLHIRHDSRHADSLIDNRVLALARGREGAIWIGTASGLERGQSTAQSFIHCPFAGSGNAAAQGAMALYADQDGTIWQGVPDGGLIHRDMHGVPLAFFSHDAHVAGSLAQNNVRAILRDARRRLWVGTDGGLDLYDAATDTFAHYYHEEGNSNSLSDSSIMSLYQDATGLLWVGTRSGGLDRWNPRSWNFGGRRPSWLRGGIALAFADAGNDRLWVGTWGGGLMLYNVETGEAQSLDTLLKRRNVLGDDRVMALSKDARGTLWIGTMTAGLRSLTADGLLTRYPVLPGTDRGLSAAGIMSVYAGPDGRIWIGTHGGGVNVLDPKTGRIQQLPYETTATGALSSRNVASIVADAAGNIWFATDGGGLDLADASGYVRRVFRHQEGDPASIPSDALNGLMLDRKDRLWIATDRGLARLRGSTALMDRIRFQSFGRAQGLAGDTVYGVLPDTSGRIWVSGNTGLTRYDPDTGDFRTYHVQHGLQNEEFESGAYFSLPDGRLVFGSPGGFNLFDPKSIDETAAAPPVALTGVDVLGAPLKSAKSFWLLTDIEVTAAARIITLEFAALDFLSPAHNRLSYRIPDLSDRWIDLGTEHHVTLTNLPSGEHRLEVRAASPGSDWGETPLRVRIYKAPPLYASSAAIVGYVLLGLVLAAIAWRIHLRRLANAQRIRHLAYFDSLTGLPNRQQCMDVAETYVERARANAEAVSFIYLDLNGFKRINDTFGHAVGDDVLRIVAEKLNDGLESFRRQMVDVMLSRFGGDEFVVLLRHATAAGVGLDVAKACQALLAAPIEYQRLELPSVPSIGLASFPRDGETAEAVLKHADTAMYQAKSAAAGAVVVYEPVMSSRMSKFVRTEARLRRALHLEALTFEFQPKFRLSDQQIVGAEVLARWHDEELGVVPPSEFIPVAEESGLIIEMGELMIRSVCRQLRAWRDVDIGLPLAINISGKEFLHGDPVRILEREAQLAGIPPSLVEIEITESLLVQDSVRVRQALDRLRSIGCLLALDDFGTGYSSLAYLTRFPLDKIKIDKSFVRHVDQSPSEAAVAQAILSLAANLHMTVTGEGIERRSQLDWLLDRGCHEGQGFYLSRPLRAEPLVNALLRRPVLEQRGVLHAYVPERARVAI